MQGGRGLYGEGAVDISSQENCSMAPCMYPLFFILDLYSTEYNFCVCT